MSIVTGSGDDGKSQMYSGERIFKHHPRLEAYGTVDEAQCALGLVRAYVNSTRDEGNTAIQDFDPLLKRVQEDLYIVGADLATPDPNMQVPRVGPEMISLVKQECERLEESLSPLTSFILPAGTRAASACFWARSVVRRAERQVSVLLGNGEKVNDILIYLNRLGDLLFLAGRALNAAEGHSDETVGRKD